MTNARPRVLKREIGVGGAIMMGLGSMVGTGAFVSIGIAAGVTGPSVILAIAVAALVATCNALSSAQLAANHAVSGGTYEYGYRFLNPALGFTAGWMFLCAKTASAATAALGFAGYLLRLVGADLALLPLLAVGAVVMLTALVLGGIPSIELAQHFDRLRDAGSAGGVHFHRASCCAALKRDEPVAAHPGGD